MTMKWLFSTKQSFFHSDCSDSVMEESFLSLRFLRSIALRSARGLARLAKQMETLYDSKMLCHFERNAVESRNLFVNTRDSSLRFSTFRMTEFTFVISTTGEISITKCLRFLHKVEMETLYDSKMLCHFERNAVQSRNLNLNSGYFLILALQ